MFQPIFISTLVSAISAASVIAARQYYKSGKPSSVLKVRRLDPS